jgi:hypothetical protein
MMKVKIYQIRDTRNTMYSFIGWNDAVKADFSIDDYELVYECQREKQYILDNLWEEFNINHPADFHGRSMSVSDVIALQDDGKDYWYWYYCDSLGWEEITEIMEGN